MKELTWKPILSNLTEALGEIRGLHRLLHFLQFRELPEEDNLSPNNADYIAGLEWRERRSPFNEISLFIRLEHAYCHLNWAWNCRRTQEDRVLHFTDSDASRWNRFPDTAAFADLWPQNRKVKGLMHKLRNKVSLEPVRVFVSMAQRKLNILCYLVAKELGRDWVRPKGLYPEIGAQPLTEKDFARRMHRIYVELNLAWNSRNDKTFATGKRAIDIRRLFPSIFATGCYNMWRKTL